MTLRHAESFDGCYLTCRQRENQTDTQNTKRRFKNSQQQQYNFEFCISQRIPPYLHLPSKGAIFNTLSYPLTTDSLYEHTQINKAKYATVHSHSTNKASNFLQVYRLRACADLLDGLLCARSLPTGVGSTSLPNKQTNKQKGSARQHAEHSSK